MEPVRQQDAMFSNIAVAFLASLGIALVAFFVVKGIYSRFSPEILHFLFIVLVILGSTVAGAIAITSGKAYRYVVSLEKGAKNLTGHVDDLQGEYGLDRYGISASDIADGYVEGAADVAKSKLGRTRTLSYTVMAVLNVLLFLFLLNAGSKAVSSRSRQRSSDDLDDLDDLGNSLSFYDLDID